MDRLVFSFPIFLIKYICIDEKNYGVWQAMQERGGRQREARQPS